MPTHSQRPDLVFIDAQSIVVSHLVKPLFTRPEDSLDSLPLLKAIYLKLTTSATLSISQAGLPKTFISSNSFIH